MPLALPATGAAAPAYAFTVTPQSGAAAAEFVLALRVAPSSNFNWTALVTAPGLDAVPLTHESSASAGVFQLAETAAERNATVRLELPYGAAVAPDARDVTVALPRTGSNVSYTFTVRAQAGTQAEEYTVTFVVAPSNNFNWTALVVPAPGETPSR